MKCRECPYNDCGKTCRLQLDIIEDGFDIEKERCKYTLSELKKIDTDGNKNK